MNIFIDVRVVARGHRTPDEDLIALIQADQDRQPLRAVLRARGISPPTQPVDQFHLDALRARASGK